MLALSHYHPITRDHSAMENVILRLLDKCDPDRENYRKNLAMYMALNNCVSPCIIEKMIGVVQGAK